MKIKIIKNLSLPIVIYGIYFFLRVNGIQPESESEIGDFITAINFLFGASVAYFVFIFASNSNVNNGQKAIWWWLMSLLLLLLATDEIFMIHETIGYYFQIHDTYVLLFYGFSLGLLLLFDTKNTLKRPTIIFLGIFFFFSVVALGADYFFNEGVISGYGLEVSYEQLAESFGALCLSASIVSNAIQLFRVNPEQ